LTQNPLLFLSFIDFFELKALNFEDVGHQGDNLNKIKIVLSWIFFPEALDYFFISTEEYITFFPDSSCINALNSILSCVNSSHIRAILTQDCTLKYMLRKCEMNHA
jgi:hypothetical protein